MNKILRSVHLRAILVLVLGLTALPSCHDLDNWDNDIYGNFDALWTEMDRHYCFFEEKGIDWDAVGRQYRAKLKPDMEVTEFFKVCSDMLAECRDGHVNLSSWFDVSYYRKWWSDYPQNFNLRLIQEHYLDFDYHSSGSMIYKYLEEENVGYIYCSTFSTGYGQAFLDQAMLSMKDSEGLILDVRDNGGGDLSTANDLVSQFIRERTLGGYICHKDGPGHDDFSEPYAFHIDPATQHVRWLKPVIILTNRSTFSAANNFVGIMKTLDHVLIVGDTTGGGSGMPYSSELPCGWSLRLSACPIYDPDMQLTEHGVEPSEGCRVDMTKADELAGRDTILDFAIRLLHAINDANNNNNDKDKNGI